MKLRVGEAARYTGLESDTLRYYESIGIVKPQRDPESGYRIYDDWDLHFLTDTKWYRSFGIPLSDVTEIVRSNALSEIVQKCQRQEAVLLRSINEQQERLMALYKHLERIERISANYGKFTWATSPAIIYQRNQVNPDPDFIRQLQKWQDLFPHVSHTFLMSVDELDDLSPESEPYFGFSLTAGNAIKYGVEPVAPAQFVPAQKCVYTIFKAEGPGTFINSFRENVLSYLQRRNLNIIGSVWGNLVVRYHEDGQLFRYFEVWIPAVEA